MAKGIWTLIGRSGLVVALLSTLASASDTVNRWSPPVQASTYAYRSDDLFELITILISISFAIVCLMLAAAVIKFRSKPGSRAHYDRGETLHDKRFTSIVSIAVFLVLDAWVLVIAMTDLREGAYAIPELDGVEDVYQVQVLGQQWSWSFCAPGIDGKFDTADDIVTINELHVPIGRPISFNITSKDVIHSFSIPAMRLKRDLNPGSINLTWFEAILTGEFDILCQELCGVSHYQMVGMLHVMEQSDFDAWEIEASRMAEFAYDAKDTEAHWAWDWQ
jgi:cytochrome c oxidase subunit 2